MVWTISWSLLPLLLLMSDIVLLSISAVSPVLSGMSSLIPDNEDLGEGHAKWYHVCWYHAYYYFCFLTWSFASDWFDGMMDFIILDMVAGSIFLQADLDWSEISS